MNKTLNLLGLAQRSDNVISGEELVVKAIQNGKAKFVFLASDASPTTKKLIENKSKYYQVAVSNEFEFKELSTAIGRPRKIIAITDDGFAKKFKTLQTT
jgi:ribosomal protein L7Ae-like RNA K-turn-binding protein